MIEQEDAFTRLIFTEFGLKCVKEYQFYKTRKWRFDYCIIDKKIAIEVEGGAFKKRMYRDKKGTLITTIGGRHNSVTGFINDIEKYNTATCERWRLIRTVPNKLMSSCTLNYIYKLIE